METSEGVDGVDKLRDIHNQLSPAKSACESLTLSEIEGHT
jgi:hypothetical protein